MDAIEVARTANSLLAVGLVTVCFMRLTRDWPNWNRRERMVRVHLIAYLAAIGYAMAEQVALNAEPGARSFIYLAVHVSFAFHLFRSRKDTVR